MTEKSVNSLPVYLGPLLRASPDANGDLPRTDQSKHHNDVYVYGILGLNMINNV